MRLLRRYTEQICLEQGEIGGWHRAFTLHRHTTERTRSGLSRGLSLIGCPKKVSTFYSKIILPSGRSQIA